MMTQQAVAGSSVTGIMGLGGNSLQETNVSVSNDNDQEVVDDPKLRYEVGLEDEDFPRVQGKDAAERTMAAAAKRLKLEGVVAAPVIDLREGKPHSVTWAVTTSMEKTGGLCHKDKMLKWSGPAKLLFKDAPDDAVVRFVVDMRAVKWEAGSWVSEWQSSETLGGSLVGPPQ